MSQNWLGIDGRVVIVTGGASGIGFQDPKEIVVRNFNGNMGFVIGNLQFHAIHSFFSLRDPPRKHDRTAYSYIYIVAQSGSQIKGQNTFCE